MNNKLTQTIAHRDIFCTIKQYLDKCISELCIEGCREDVIGGFL